MASTNFINECKNRANANRLGKIIVDGIDTPITNSDNLQSFEIDSGCYVDGNIIGSVYAKCLKANFIADQNNLRHDNGCAGFGEIFDWDFVTLRPNAELIINEPKADTTKYLNLNADITDWNVYAVGVEPIEGNECFELYPSRFGGLSYTIKGYSMDDVAIIETRDYGQVQIYIGESTEGKFSITDNPVYELVK